VSARALRRTIHASTCVVVLAGAAVGWSEFRFWMTGLGVVGMVVEGLRLRLPTLASRLRRLAPVFRPDELRHPSGAFWLLLGYVGASWVPAPGPAAGILVAALADPVAAMVGGRWGGGRRKSWVGSGAVWAVSLAALAVSGLPIAALAAGSVAAAALERWSQPADDNLVLPPGVALVVWALS
jgi:dolichol kinase